MAHFQAENEENDGTVDDRDEYMKAISAISKGMRPDPITGEVEFSDIIQYINTHIDDPNVRRFLSESKKRRGRQEEERRMALAAFNIKNLRVHPNTSWLISLEYAGLTTDPKVDDDWNLPDPDNDNSPLASSSAEVPQQTFQLFCYIREGPGTDAGDNSRHVQDFIGLPTSQQVEDFIKISMARPIECYSPSIPTLLAFSQNLNVHKQSLTPFLTSLPRVCNYIFETPAIHNRMRDEGHIRTEHQFREYIIHATQLKDAGNNALKKGDRAEAVAKYGEAVYELEALLLKQLSEEEERDREVRNLVAVCWANSSVARMLDGEGKDPEDAKKDAEKAIKADPGYAKGYLRLARAQEALSKPSAAQEALIMGLRHESLQDHWGLADNLILIQTDGQGLPNDKDAFREWQKDILESDQESAARMKNIAGAWKKRCDEHAKTLGI